MEDSLCLNLEFNNFDEAFSFLEKVRILANELDHHPDIKIYDYKKVEIKSITHSAGNKVTKLDYDITNKIKKLYESRKTQKVDPFKVLGEVDYDKLIKEFGVSYISKEQILFLENLAKKKNMKLHPFLKRGLFYAQKDLDKIIQDLKNNRPIFLYTGRAPGGSMHIGHLIPFLFTKYLQDLFDCNLYIQIPDDEKFMFKEELTLEKVDEMTKSDLIDLSAIGFNENKTFIFRNSEFIEKMYKLHLKTSKKITFNQVKNTFGFNESSNIGVINYPSLQIVPTFFEKNRCLIPMAIDQNPYFMLQRDFAKKIGFKKNSTILSKFLPPLTGALGKMSASDSNKAILLTDDNDTIKNKINKYAFSGGGETLEEHKKYGGNPDIDVSYIWLKYIFEEDDNKLKKIYEDYKKGVLLSGELKKILIEKVIDLLDKHKQNKKKVIENNLVKKYMRTGELSKKMWED